MIDKELEFSDAQAETTVAVHDSDAVIDAIKPGDSADELYLVVSVNTTCTSGGSATVQVKLLTDDNAAFSSAKTLVDSGLIAVADLVAGYNIVTVRLPKGVERYLKVTYGIATAALTAGAFDAYLVDVPQTN